MSLDEEDSRSKVRDGNAISLSRNDSTAHDTLKYHLLGPSLTKAGQDQVDQQKVAHFIYHRLYYRVWSHALIRFPKSSTMLPKAPNTSTMRNPKIKYSLKRSRRFCRENDNWRESISLQTFVEQTNISPNWSFRGICRRRSFILTAMPSMLLWKSWTDPSSRMFRWLLAKGSSQRATITLGNLAAEVAWQDSWR